MAAGLDSNELGPGADNKRFKKEVSILWSIPHRPYMSW
jgi:hypothetical protein